MDELRSGSKQISDALAADYKRMTDPEEMEKHRMERERAQVADGVAADAGL